MQFLVDKYVTHGSSYLLPIIGRPGHNERTQYKSRSQQVNRYLKRVGELAGLSTPLTMYVARHSWASIARSRNIPMTVISEGLGHTSERTTRIYLDSLDTARIDEANSLVLSGL